MRFVPTRCFQCVRCGATAERPAQGRKTPFCHRCSAERIHESSVAHGQVGFAIRKGTLDKPSSFSCTDCGAPAKHYDHRDYSRPLDVQPVCISCNFRRPPAFDSKYRPPA